MTKVPPQELATPEEWSQARHRESILRPLVVQPSLSEPEIELAGKKMGVGRAYFYRLLSAYKRRPQTSTLLPRRDGLRTGTHLLPPGTESIVHKCIEEFYMSRVRPSFAALTRAIFHECHRCQIAAPNFRTIKRRLATYDPKDLIASRFGSKAAREAFRPVQEHDLPALPFQLLQIDHSPVDLIVVDDRDRLPIGRPWLTLAALAGFVCVAFGALRFSRCLAIVLDSERRARDVWERARANNTADNFGDLAAQYSVEQGSQAGDTFVIATQGARSPDGSRPAPSGVLVGGETAEVLNGLVEVVEEAEVEAILGDGQ